MGSIVSNTTILTSLNGPLAEKSRLPGTASWSGWRRAHALISMIEKLPEQGAGIDSMSGIALQGGMSRADLAALPLETTFVSLS